jgi:hypothetical protein
VQYYNGTAWVALTSQVTFQETGDPNYELVVIKLDFSDPQSDGNVYANMYYGDGTAASMSKSDANDVATATVTIAEVKAACIAEYSIGWDTAIGKNNGMAAGIFDYVVLEGTVGGDGNYEGYEWTTTKDERVWERTPTSDGDDDGWTLNGNDANCPNDAYRTVDDCYDDDDQANDYLSATDPAGGPAVDQLFGFQDQVNTPDAVCATLITKDHSKVADYNAHWKDEGGTERQKALLKGYQNGTNGTTLSAFLATQDGTQTGTAWSDPFGNGAQFGFRLVSAASADGAVYGFIIGFCGDSMGAQTNASACPATFTPRVIGPY